jgi:hypothetical protein
MAAAAVHAQVKEATSRPSEAQSEKKAKKNQQSRFWRFQFP